MSAMTLVNLEQIKREAKKLKKQYPELPHSKRLDFVSMRSFGLPNYYVAQQQIEKKLSSMLTIGDSKLATCSYCDLLFCTDLPEDVNYHKKWHLNYEKAEIFLGFIPPFRENRERSKRNAYTKLRSSNLLSEQVEAALQIIRAHFDRSLNTAIRDEYWRDHPSFTQYVAMVDDYKGSIPTEVMALIRKKYGKIPGHIREGMSYWFPAKK